MRRGLAQNHSVQLTRLLSIAICVTFALRCVAASADPAAAELARALDKKAVELFKSGRYEEAAAHVKRALVIWNDLSPDYRVEVSAAHYNLGQSYLAQGKLTEAERHARSASQLAEGCTTPAIRSRITVLIANIHFQAGEYAEAERQLRAALPDLEGVEKATGLNDLAMTRAALGDLAAARGLLDSSIAILEEAGVAAGPQHGWVLANLALIRSLQGDLSAAATLFS